MKRASIFIILIISFFVFQCCVGPQKSIGISDGDVPPNTNTTIVETEMDAATAYRTVAQILLNRGYTFHSTDETLKSISTEFKGISQRWGVDYTFVRIGVNIQGESNAKAIVRGWYKTIENKSDETGQRIRKYGQNGSPVRDAWLELYNVATKIGGVLKFEKLF